MLLYKVSLSLLQPQVHKVTGGSGVFFHCIGPRLLLQKQAKPENSDVAADETVRAKYVYLGIWRQQAGMVVLTNKADPGNCICNAHS